MMQAKKPTERPATALRFAVLKDLRSSGATSPGETLQRLGELAPAHLRGTLRLRLLPGGGADKEAVFTAAMGGGKAINKKSAAKSKSKSAAKLTVELVTTPQTWGEVAAGRMAPHDAFLSGLMRVRGDVRLAQRLLKHAAGSDGLTAVCHEEEA